MVAVRPQWLVLLAALSAPALGAEWERPANLDFRWDSAEVLRMRVSWSASVTRPDGTHDNRSGVTHLVLDVAPADGGLVLSAGAPRVARVTPPGDLFSSAVSTKLSEPWSVVLDGDGHAVVEQPEPPVAAEADAAAPAAVDATEVPAEAPVEGEAPPADAVAEVPAEPDEESADPADAYDPRVGPDIGAIVLDMHGPGFEQIFGAWSGAVDADGSRVEASVTLSLRQLPFCPGPGPGTHCVAVSSFRGQAAARGALDPGERRVTESAVLGETDLRPHLLELAWEEAWEGPAMDEGDFGTTWTVEVERQIAFLPLEAPS